MRSYSDCGLPEITVEGLGTLTSPGYPGMYDNFQECVWTLTASENYRIVVEFSMFDLEYCPYDTVVVRKDSSTMIYRNCYLKIKIANYNNIVFWRYIYIMLYNMTNHFLPHFINYMLLTILL